jgi:hypothetical protein
MIVDHDIEYVNLLTVSKPCSLVAATLYSTETKSA